MMSGRPIDSLASSSSARLIKLLDLYLSLLFNEVLLGEE